MIEENKFKKDVAEPQVNIKSLNQIFDIDTTTGEILNPQEASKELKEIKKELKEIEESMIDVDEIIVSNIERANRFLDLLEEQIIKGNISATMMEACATLINAVTTAATSITGISYNNELLDIRRYEASIREKKVTIDAMRSNTPTNVTGDVHITQNTITMTREELLKEMKGK